MLALIYSALLIVFIGFPVETPVTLSTLNWAPVMFAGVVALAFLYYVLHATKVYKGPAADLESVE